MFQLEGGNEIQISVKKLNNFLVRTYGNASHISVWKNGNATHV